MKRFYAAIAGAAALSACGDGTFFTGDPNEADADTSEESVYLTEQGTFLTLNNIIYNEAEDTLILNNIPFDDPDNVYERVTTESFNNNFDAYQSNPESGTNEIEYFAVFRRSDSGQTQVAAVGTAQYVDFGYGGAGAQRLGGRPNLPTSGIFSYNGEYAAVRTTLAASGSPQRIEYVTGEANLAVDYDDFDVTGAAGAGTITNRTLYDSSGRSLGSLSGFISLQDSTLDFETGTIEVSGATLFESGTQIEGNWSGVLAGPNGEEVAGIIFVEGSNIRETGAFIAEQ